MSNSATETPIQTSQKSGGLFKMFCITCSVLFLCLCFCIIASIGIIFLVFGAAVTAFNDEVVSEICENKTPAQIEAVYEGDTTKNFRSTTSLSEFEDTIEEMQDSVCKDVEDLNVFKVIMNGWDMSYDNNNGIEELKLKGEINNKMVDLRLKTENGEMKIDYLTVK